MTSHSVIHGGGTSTPELEESDLKYFCDLIEERAGIHLKPAKHDLVRTRLRSRIGAHNLQSYTEYKDLLASLSDNNPEWEIFTNLLTTNKTDFFREPKHFDFLINQIIPEWSRTHQKTFKVWSAACSTGEEPYTLAMILSRYLPKGKDFKIFATDIDTEVLKVAQNAVYGVTKQHEIPKDYQQPCIELGRREAKNWFRIKPELKERVVFKQHNLIERMAPNPDTFDLVLCRNVLIYFAPENIDFVQAKLFTTVKPGGHFFIGHSESLQGMKHRWKSVSPSVFKKAA